jgi:signal transduction histidine kinase
MKFALSRDQLKWILSLTCILAFSLAWLGIHHLKSSRRIYRIGFDNQPPQHFTGKDGKPAGLIVELINEAASRRDIRLQWSQQPESSEAALTTRKVDLWPIMTIRPERRGKVYITEPYREDTICLFVLSRSAFKRLQDLADFRIAFDGEPLDVKLLHPYVPNAKLVVIESPKERLEAVCARRVEAAYFDQATAMATFLDGISCGEGLRVIQARELSGFLGIGATFQAKSAADELRAEIGRMAVDGTLESITSRWSALFGRNLAIASELARAQTRERWLIVGVLSLIFLLFYVLWQAGRIRQALASARQATVLKNQFLANMSHEIRTPMNAILGMTSLAMETSDPEEHAEFLNDVKSAGESLLSLLNDILDLSKIEAGELTFERIKFDPADVIREVCGLFGEGARKKGLILVYRWPAEFPDQVWGDPARLRQVLVNLVGNAIKFTETGRVEVEAAIADSAPDHMLRICFAVKDTGIGIAKESQQRIFESFVQADGSVTRKYGGTGLGLSISRQLISRLGGELRLESALGRGSIFSFTLPFEKVHGSSLCSAQRNEQLERSTVLMRIRPATAHPWTGGADQVRTPPGGNIARVKALKVWHKSHTIGLCPFPPVA